MKRITMALAAAAAAFLSLHGTSSAQDLTRLKNLQDHVYYFASDSLQGRKAGSEFSAKAARYIQSEYEKAGLLPLFESGWEMPFSRNGYEECNFFNIVGYIPGSDPVLKDEIIVIGAHFDHLGVRYDGEVFNGADDNASGSAALIEVAKQLSQNRSRLKRTVVVAGFDGEEMGLFGSNALADAFSDQGLIDRVKLMISVDMVGWLQKGGSLMMEGTGTVKNARSTLSRHATAIGLPISTKKFETSLFTATDTQGFAEKGVATLDMTTGTKSPYHKVGDDPELIDYEGLDKICEYISAVVTDFASDPGYQTTGKVAPKHRSRIRTFEIAPMAGIGTTSLEFADAKLYTSGNMSLQAGLAAKINIRKGLALQVEGLFEKIATPFPVEGSLFTERGKLSQTAISVPAMILAQYQSHTERVFIGAGPFYRKSLDHKFSSNITTPYSLMDEGFGLAFTFGAGVGPFVIGLDMRIMDNIFGKGINASMTTSNATLSWWF